MILKILSIDQAIAIRNKPNFKLKQKAFNNELSKMYDSVGKALDPDKFISSFDRTMTDWTNELAEYGIGVITCGLSAYILLQSNSATNPEYLKQILECGLVVSGGITLIKNLNRNLDRKYCRQYLTQLEAL